MTLEDEADPRCSSMIHVNRRAVRCSHPANHPGDGSTVLPSGRLLVLTTRYRADADDWTIDAALYEATRDPAPRVDTLTLDLFAQEPPHE